MSAVSLCPVWGRTVGGTPGTGTTPLRNRHGLKAKECLELQGQPEVGAPEGRARHRGVRPRRLSAGQAWRGKRPPPSRRGRPPRGPSRRLRPGRREPLTTHPARRAPGCPGAENPAHPGPQAAAGSATRTSGRGRGLWEGAEGRRSACWEA